MATTTITNLPTVTSLTGNEPLLGVQNGNSVQITTGQIAKLSGGTSGYLLSSVTQLANNPIIGTPSTSTYLRGDGTWAAVSASATSIAVGITTVTSSTSGYILYNNAGTLGNLATTGSGSVTLNGSPTFTGTVTSPFYLATGDVTGSLSSGAYSYGSLSYSDSNIYLSATSSQNSYSQAVLQNTNSGASASVNYLVSNNLGTASTYYGEFGMNSSGFSGTGALAAANAVYLDSTSADLVIGTTTSNAVHFVVNSGATDAATISSSGIFSLGTPLAVGSGGLGISTTPANGYIPIGNGTNYTAAALTAGSNITITNTAGGITIASTGGGGSGTVTSVAQTFTGGLISVSGSPITSSGTLALTVAGTSGGIPYFGSASTWASSAALTANALMIGGGAGAAPATTTTGTGVLTALGNSTNAASGIVVKDANANITTNALYQGFTNAAATTTITLTASSTPNRVVTGSGGQTFTLPDATTLPVGATFTFNNNQSSGAITVNNNSSTLIVSIPSGGFATVTLLTNSVAAGTWDYHFGAPANVSWSTNTFSYPGSITSATWTGNVIGVGYGGLGITTTPSNGFIPIGNGTNYTAAALTAGANITITNASGAITIASTGGGGMVYPSAGIANSTGSAWGTSYSTTGSGTVIALATSPSFTTPTLGAASATSINKVTITAPATSATLTLADGSTLATSGANSITFSSSGTTTLTLPTSGTVTALGNTVTGTGNIVLATSPTLVTPTLGAASATSINKVAITAPATSATLTLADTSTLATSGAFSITLTSTAATNVTLPTSGTLATTANINTALPSATASQIYVGTGSAGAAAAASTLPTSAFPALTGDVTNTSGTLATTVGKIGGNAVSLGGAFTLSGAFATTLSVSGTTTLTLPTSGTVTALGNTTTGSGNIVLATSPTLTTPTITTSATVPFVIGGTGTGSTLTLQSTSGVGTTDSVVIKVGNNGATTALTASTTGQITVNSGGLTVGVAGTTAGSVVLSGGTSGTTTLVVAATTSGTLTLPAGTGTVTALGNTTTGSGSIVLATSPTLTTPTLGVASATTINKVTLTAPATGSTLTIADGKTLTVSNTLTLAGTDSTVMTFPSSTTTVAGLGTTQTFTATNTFSQVNYTNNAVTVTSNAGTVPITYRLNTFTNSSAATMAITMATASAVDGQMSIVRIYDFSAAAQTIGWTNTENSTVSVPTTSNGSTTLPLTVGFMYNGQTSKWRCIASA
jgi:hypothetical protein